MTPEHWQKIDRVLQSALELQSDERGRFLDEACAGDATLRREVESFIVAHEQASGFIETPAIQNNARVVVAQDQAASAAGQTIAHYRIIKQLGSGGMGEVYLASDTRLNRNVALKLLPAYFTHEERIRRFKQEARAVLALNHPNIVTIYEIGEANSTHYIATEFIDGLTLRQRVARAPLQIIEVLDVATQAASALIAAHAAGIVHRDIKPDNIMLREDGYVKVLDFGLAKLNKERTTDSEAATRALVRTDPRMVMGTASYMSPEQARGLQVDARTDVWSLGAVLYELLTGQTPFAGKTVSDMIASILEREPAPLARYAPQVPEALEWIVTKALTKDLDDRYQTIRELHNDLRRLKQQLDVAKELERSGPPQTARLEEIVAVSESYLRVKTKLPTSGTEEQRATPTVVNEKSPLVHQSPLSRKNLAIALIASLVIAGSSFVLYKRFFQSRAPSPLASFQTMKISRLTSVGKTTDTAISPDGKYVTYVVDDGARQTLWLHHVPTNSDKEIAVTADLRYRSLVFSHSGDYIFFIGSGKNQDDGLYRVTVLGGDLRKLSGNLGNSASSVTLVKSIALSPDDTRVAFSHNGGMSVRGESALIILNVDGTGERKLITRLLPERIAQPGWSSDGKTIACTIFKVSAGYSSDLVEVNVEDGKVRQLSQRKWWNTGRIAWLRDGSGFVMTASDQPSGNAEVWYVSYPEGQARKVTNDLNQYDNVSLTSDSSTLVAVQENNLTNLSIAPNGDTSSLKLIAPNGFNGYASQYCWTPDNHIVYAAMSGDTSAVWVMDADGKNPRSLTSGMDSHGPVVSPDGRYIVYTAFREGATNIWRIDADGSNPKQLTEDHGSSPSFTPDGRGILYFIVTPTGPEIAKVSIEGGAPVQVTDQKMVALNPVVSPDGKFIAIYYAALGPSTGGVVRFHTAIIPFAGGEPVKIFENPGALGSGIKWTADSRALTYISTRDDVSNIWEQPLDGSQPKQLTNFTSEQIFSYDWSRDGKQLLLLRGTLSNDVVMLSDFK
jgi:serine/threonine protein kinase/Tol biopolymer transport system component